LFDGRSGSRICFFFKMLISILKSLGPEDSLMYGGDRDFILTRRMFLVTVDQRLAEIQPWVVYR
jgi:hypothetical protein